MIAHIDAAGVRHLIGSRCEDVQTHTGGCTTASVDTLAILFLTGRLAGEVVITKRAGHEQRVFVNDALASIAVLDAAVGRLAVVKVVTVAPDNAVLNDWPAGELADNPASCLVSGIPDDCVVPD